MQIPIINGIYADAEGNFRVSYPLNLVPVPVSSGISAGYLRQADAVAKLGDAGPGVCRGGINWNGTCFRIMGTTLVEIDENGAVKEHGTVGGVGHVTFSYSFDYLAVSSGKNLYLFDGSTLTAVTDADLGDVIDHIWIDGYFLTTDGEFLVVTELNDPFSVNPLKYGSSEIDPDPVKAIIKLNNEPYVVNRYTIEVFNNVGGANFPFQRVQGAQIQKGSIGKKTCCVFQRGVAFIGGGHGDSMSVWLTSGGQEARISTYEIDLILEQYTEEALSNVLIEVKADAGHEQLHIHLPDQTLVFDADASTGVGEKVWFRLSSEGGRYRANHFVRCYDKWLVADTNSGDLGYLTDKALGHWGEVVQWEFNTPIAYNEGSGAIFHEIELVSLQSKITKAVQISTQYSVDGMGWSQHKYINIGPRGKRTKRLVWLNQGNMKHWRIQRFAGTSDASLSFARLEVRLETLL